MAVERYIYDGQNVLEEADDNDVIKATYTYEPEEYGKLLTQSRNDNQYYYHYDALGTTYDITNDTEIVSDSYLYDCWGQILEQSGNTVNPFKWLGKVGYYFDEETSDYYVRARFYFPTVGRWISQDPLGFVNGLNLYLAYFVPGGSDPSGLLNNESACPDPPYAGDVCSWGEGLPTIPKFPPFIPPSRGNCWRYVCDDPIKPTDPPGTDHYPVPGGAKPGKDGVFDCFELGIGISEVGGVLPELNGDCRPCYYKILLVVSRKPSWWSRPWLGTEGDFHFYRQSPDGTWSHKPGSTRVESPILDPERHANRNGYTLCHTYYCLPNGGVDLDRNP